METFKQIAEDIVALHDKKNHDYGNAFADSFKEFGLTSAIIRLNDKMNRLKSLNGKEGLVKDESVRDTLMDLAAYAIMTIEQMEGGAEVDTRKNKVLTQEKLEELWPLCTRGLDTSACLTLLMGNNRIGLALPAGHPSVASFRESLPGIIREFFNFGYDVTIDMN